MENVSGYARAYIVPGVETYFIVDFNTQLRESVSHSGEHMTSDPILFSILNQNHPAKPPQLRHALMLKNSDDAMLLQRRSLHARNS
jgi:hypothetical protein